VGFNPYFWYIGVLSIAGLGADWGGWQPIREGLRWLLMPMDRNTLVEAMRGIVGPGNVIVDEPGIERYSRDMADFSRRPAVVVAVLTSSMSFSGTEPLRTTIWAKPSLSLRTMKFNPPISLTSWTQPANTTTEPTAEGRSTV